MDMSLIGCLNDVYVRGDQPPARGLGLYEPLDEGQQAEGDEGEGQGQQEQEQPLYCHLDGSGFVLHGI